MKLFERPLFILLLAALFASASLASNAGDPASTIASSAGDRPGPAAAAARKASALLDVRIEEMEAAGPAAERNPTDTGPSVTAAMSEIRRLLIEEGLERDLAEILTVLPAGRPEAGAPLASSAGVLRETRRRLHAFAAAAEGDRHVPPLDARARLEGILRDPVFKTEPANAGFLARLANGIKRFLFRRIEALSLVLSRHPAAVRILAVAIIAAALIFVALIVFSFLWPPYLGRLSRSASSPRAAAAEGSPDDPQKLLARAGAEAAAGRLGPAIKLFEKAAVLALRARGELPHQRGLTDLESVRVLQERGVGSPRDIEAVFTRLAELHDRCIYARRTLGAETVEEAARLAGEIVGRGSERAA